MREFLIQRMLAIIYGKDFSERQASRYLGYSTSYINKIKNGDIPLTIEFLEKFCEDFDLKPEEFFSLSGAYTPNQYMLLQETKELTNEDVEFLSGIAKHLKKKDRQTRKRK